MPSLSRCASGRAEQTERGNPIPRSPSGRTMVASPSHQALFRTASWTQPKNRRSSIGSILNRRSSTTSRLKVQQGTFVGRTKLSWEAQHARDSDSPEPEGGGGDGGSMRKLEHAVRRAWRAFAARGYVFDHTSSALAAWEWMLTACVLYNATYLPMELVFPFGAAWEGSFVVGTVLDVVFLADIAVKLRSSFRERGYDVTAPDIVRDHYMRGKFCIDLLASVPPFLLDRVVAPALGDPIYLEADRYKVLRTFRLLRIHRVVHKLGQLANLQYGGNAVRMMVMVFYFVLIAHLFGCAYFGIAIRPLFCQDLIRQGVTDDPACYAHRNDERALQLNEMRAEDEWIWLPSAGAGEERPPTTAVMYLCSVYWAMSVMTNLKGLPAHESRQCFLENPHVTYPVEERAFTICVFLCGAIVYASLYGNIGLIIQNLDASGQRFRRSMQEMNEFFRFHSVPPPLQKRIKDYMEFSFSVTRGIDVESIHSQLPARQQRSKVAAPPSAWPS